MPQVDQYYYGARQVTSSLALTTPSNWMLTDASVDSAPIDHIDLHTKLIKSIEGSFHCCSAFCYQCHAGMQCMKHIIKAHYGNQGKKGWKRLQAMPFLSYWSYLLVVSLFPCNLLQLLHSGRCTHNWPCTGPTALPGHLNLAPLSLVHTAAGRPLIGRAPWRAGGEVTGSMQQLTVLGLRCPKCAKFSITAGTQYCQYDRSVKECEKLFRNVCIRPSPAHLFQPPTTLYVLNINDQIWCKTKHLDRWPISMKVYLWRVYLWKEPR